jgi:hypothetical protein
LRVNVDPLTGKRHDLVELGGSGASPYRLLNQVDERRN